MKQKRIPQEKKYEDELYELYEMYHSIFHATSVGISHADPLTRKFKRVNSVFCTITGYTESELLSMTVDQLNHPEDRDKDSQLYTNIAGSKIPKYEIEKRYIRKDNHIIWVHVSSSIIRDKRGKPLTTIGVIRDITEKKAIEENERRLRELADSMPQLVWTANSDGTVDYYNEKKQLFDGITESEQIYEWAPIVHPDDLEETWNAWKAAVKGKNIYEMEHRIKMKGGEYRWFLSRAIPVKDMHGNINKWYGTATDIHASKILDQKKDEFLSVASHELKTPVTSIKAYTQVLKAQFTKLNDKRAVQFLDRMEIQVNRLTTLIADLLDVTKIHAGKLQLRENTFDFDTMVEDSIEQIRLTSRSHYIHAHLTASQHIYADPERIAQVITNFIDNAIKYSPHSKKIIVSSKSTVDEIIFCVRDFGVGIPVEKQHHIFKRFYRVEGEKEETFPGLGLGLFISQEIIMRHNGKIWFTSNEGTGSTFYFSLPLRREK